MFWFPLPTPPTRKCSVICKYLKYKTFQFKNLHSKSTIFVFIIDNLFSFDKVLCSTHINYVNYAIVIIIIVIIFCYDVEIEMSSFYFIIIFF